MKLYAPKYYEKFKCIADKCKHSCCIGWEIDIDKLTLNKYNSLCNSYTTQIKNSIDFSDSPYFKLKDNGNCCHLNEEGLCNIIFNCGEDYLCDICREHPRFYNFTNWGKEVGIGMSCEAACEIILNSDHFDEFIEVTKIDGDVDICEYDATIDRRVIFSILKNHSLSIEDKVEMISHHFDVSSIKFNVSKVISQLEFLNEDDKTLILQADKLYWNNNISDKLTRILAYYVYRHCSETCYYDEFCISLSYAIFCTELISTLSNEDTINDVARIISEEIEYSTDNTHLIKSLFY